MPLWLVYHPEGTFTTAESKQALVSNITPIYTDGGLPAFYVVVNFVQLPSSCMFVGGKPPVRPFIRITVDHLAVHFSDNVPRRERVLSRIDQALKPHIADNGYDWEYSIDETPRELWKINGVIPPPFQSGDEKNWATLNKPVEWHKTEEKL
ncbi:putative oxalocrotonate tautomerase [Podospora didyma]|uniref:Oxalocrotonate tautomerase n=1 Tax=Podospora didyma TaxID=330526 RepID=A0AAE0K1U8_9PEZI|nr:putative oxalocrotonate tautomerase [Podospora didyma]